MLTDCGVLNVYNLRAPNTFVRFARLRLFVRVVAKAPFGLLALLFAARGDSKSWISAVEDDIGWIGLCSPKHTFTTKEWIIMCRRADES